MKICIHSLTQLNYTMIFNLFLFMQSLPLKTRKIGQSFCFPSLEDQCSLCGQHFTTMKHMEEQKLHKLRGTYSHVCRVKIGSWYISDSVFLSEEEQRQHLNENVKDWVKIVMCMLCRKCTKSNLNAEATFLKREFDSSEALVRDGCCSWWK